MPALNARTILVSIPREPAPAFLAIRSRHERVAESWSVADATAFRALAPVLMCTTIPPLHRSSQTTRNIADVKLAELGVWNGAKDPLIQESATTTLQRSPTLALHRPSECRLFSTTTT